MHIERLLLVHLGNRTHWVLGLKDQRWKF